MPPPLHVFWSDDPADNVIEHIAEHGVTMEEVEAVLLRDFDLRVPSRAGTGRWVVVGDTPSGRRLTVVFDYYPEEFLAVPVTAYDC